MVTRDNVNGNIRNDLNDGVYIELRDKYECNISAKVGAWQTTEQAAQKENRSLLTSSLKLKALVFVHKVITSVNTLY